MHTFILGDLHLTDAEAQRYYKRHTAFADERLLQCLEWIAGHAEQRLVLSGDVFDLDLVVPPDPASDPGELAAQKLRLIFRDHRPLMARLAEFAAQGRLHLLMGNHDLELALPAAWQALEQELERHAPGASQGLKIHPWALYEPGLLWAEHGQVYDHYACTIDPLDPRLGSGVYFPFGCLVNQQLSNALLSFNPNSDVQVHQGIAGYLRHWLRYAPWPPWRLPLAYLANALTVYRRALEQRRELPRLPTLSELSERARRQLDVNADQARELLRNLPRPVIQFSRFEPLRTLLLDKALLLPLLAALAIGGAASGASLMAALFWPLLAVGIYKTYEWLLGPSKAVNKTAGLPQAGLAAAATLDVPLVVMGHSHEPGLVKRQGRTYLNAGSWGPLFDDVECTQRSGWADTLVHIEHNDGPPRAELLAWRDGRAIEFSGD